MTSYTKPRSQKTLLRNLKIDLAYMQEARLHAAAMENRLYIDTPLDVAEGVSSFIDSAKQLTRALEAWARVLDERGDEAA